MLLSIVIPCFNEEAVLADTHARLTCLARGWQDSALVDGYEVIYVDDGSLDATLDRLKEIAVCDTHVKVISFSRNFGHQAALTAGLEHAQGDSIVSLDADLQDPPETIETMIRRYREGYDIVFGVRQSRDTDTAFKRTTARLFYKMMSAMGVKLVYDHADFRLISRRVVEAFKRYGEINCFLRGVFAGMGFRSCAVTYARARRHAGKTKYPLRKMIEFAIEGITSFSLVPLRLASIIGGCTFVVSLVLGTWAIVTHILGHAIPGWASMVLPLYVFSGLQMILLGIVGEYIGKIYMETKRRPRYLVRETVNISKSRVER